MPYRQKRRAPSHDAGRRPAKRQSHQRGPHLPGKLLRQLQPDDTLNSKPARKGSDHAAAIAAEDALQAQLAKKLGIKTTSKPRTALPPVQLRAHDTPPSTSSDEGVDDEGGSDFDWLEQSDMEDNSGEDAGDGDQQAAQGDMLLDSEDDDLDNQALDVDTDDDDTDDNSDDNLSDDDNVPATPHPPTPRASKASPGQRPYQPPALRAVSGTDEAISRRVRGLLNRLAEGTLAWVVGQLEELHQQQRQAVELHVIEQLIEAVREGPRATDAFAAVTACCVAALAAKTRSQALAARFLERLARMLNQANAQGHSVAAGNLVNVFAHVYACSLIGPEVLYGLLDALRARLAEQDVALIAAVLRACGARLRADDPVAMKAFVVSVHARAAEAAKEAPLSARTEAMLGLVLDVKNNRAKQGSTASALSPAAARWVAGCGVVAVQLRNLSWPLLLEENKTGRWWEGHLQPLHADGVGNDAPSSATLPEDEVGTERLRALAARLRLNTDTRRTVFYAVMGSSDVVDATERLLRLPLKERTWNPFYAHLLLRLAASSRAHVVTLRYCLWDQVKGLQGDEGLALEPRKAVNLARLLATLVARGGLPLLALRVVDWASPMGELATLTWQTWCKHLCMETDAQGLTDIAARAIATKGSSDTCRGMASFVRHEVVPSLSDESVATKAALLAKLLHKGAAVAVA